MKFLFDLFPVILFFIVFKTGESHALAAQSLAQQYLSGVGSGGAPVALDQAPILLATAVAIVATVVQILYLLIRRRKVDPMLWMSFGIIGVFGGATIYFHNDNFIKWKPTVLYWCFTVGLIGSHILMKRNIIRSMLEQQIALPESVWTRLNFAWAGFFAFMGALNLAVAFNFPTSVWVNFKLFGGTGLMIVFIVAQTLFLSKHIKDAP
ncbi:MAG: septation protein A [Burkholderiaceae bacterium]